MGISYRAAAEALWGEAGAYTHDAYTRWRPLLPELPEQLPIVIGITAYGHCIGLTRGDWGAGPRISIASNQFTTGRHYVDDVMIHEMLHCWLHLTGRETKHADRPWYEHLRRLSPAVLGRELEARRGAERKSIRVTNPRAEEPGQPATVVRKVSVHVPVAHRDVAAWPHSFRPEGYDWGEPIDCPSY